MMDRNREARRAAAMANGLPRRRHRTTSGSLRDSPEDDGPLELQEPARLRDRPVKKDRDREIRDRDRDHRDRERERERERDRLSRSKRRRGDKYLYGSNREDGGGGGDDSSEESVNDEDEEDDDGPGPVRYVPPSNHPVQMMSSSAASTLTSHRKSYPPPTKIFRQSVAPTWKAPDEMIGVSVPRKARSASTKRSQDSWGAGGGGVVVSGEQIHLQASASPVRSTMTASATAPSPSPAPMSPSSSNVSIKKKIKPNGPTKQKPPKSCLKSSSASPPIQDDIEIEVAEVLYGLKRQSQAPSSLMQEIAAVSNDSAKFDSNRSAGDSKSRVSSPISAPFQPSPVPPQNSSSSASPLTTVAPKRKRPRPYPDENPAGFGPRSRPISPTPKMEADQALKVEAPASEKNLVGSAMENGDVANSNDLTSDCTPPVTVADGAVQDAKPPVVVVANGTVGDAKEDSGIKDGVVVMRAKVEEASSSPKMESQDQSRVESTSTSTKPKSAVVEKENRREDKLEIDLMASPSPEREGEGEYGGGAAAIMGDEKPMVTDGQTEANPNVEEDEKGVKLNASEAQPETKDKAKAKAKSKAKLNAKPVASESESQGEPHKEPPPCEQQQQPNLSCKERNIDVQLDLDKANRSTPTNEHKLDLQQQQLQKQPPPKIAKDEPIADKNGSSSVPLPMSVAAGWHGGLGPMGYVAPLHGVVSMDATSIASPPIQGPHFVFSPPKPKRCATHCYIARSVSVHQQMMKMNPYWPPAAAGTAPLFGAKPYNLNMVPPPPDLHAAAAAAGRGGVANSALDKAQPFALFPAQPSSKDKSPLSATAPDANAQKKQFLLPQSLPPGAPSNMLHAPAFFFPFGQQQAAAAAAAAAASARPSSTKSPSTGGSAASTTTTSTSPMGASSATMAAGPAMSFSYPNMGGNETQFMAILGNGAYPFPVPAHVGAAPPYRGSHPQAMSFFNGSFYSSQMLHPSQLQQQQSAAPQPMQIQQQNHQNPSISTASSSSQKHLQQNQQQRPQGGAGTAGAGISNPSWQNFPAAKGRPHHDTGGEDSPSTADSRTRPNLSVYGQNLAMPFHSPNFALMTPPSSMVGSGNNTAGGPNGGGHSDKKQQQQQQQQPPPPPQQQGLKGGIESLAPAFPMSFAAMNGATAPGLDISSMAQNHAILQSLPEAARHNYQIMAAAAQAAQAAHQKKNNYRGPEDGKSGGGSSADASNVEEERKAMSSRASGASVGQSIAFSRDLAETAISTVPGGSVVDSSARSLNLIPGGSVRPARSSGPNAGANSSNASNSQQQQSQMLFTKQQQYVAATVAAARSKTPATSNGTVYPDHLTSSVIAGKFPNALGSFPPLVQSGGTSVQSPQWKNSVRPNTAQVSSPSLASATSTAPNNKNLPQQQGRPQQNHTQISFGVAAAANPKPPSSQGQQTQNTNQAPSPPMMVGSPSTSSMSKSAGGSPRAATSASTCNKAGAQASTLSTQQGKNSQSPSLSGQKPSILGSPHIIQSSSAGGKPQLHDSQQQPQLSKQSIHQAQLFFSSAYMHPSGNPSAAASAGSGYYLQRHRSENQQPQQQQQGLKSQGSGTTPTSSSGMLSLGTPVSLANASTSDPAKAVVAAAAAANSMKGLQPHGIFHAAQFAQSAGGTHQLVPAGFSYVHAVPAAVQVKPAEQKQPAGE